MVCPRQAVHWQNLPTVGEISDFSPLRIISTEIAAQIAFTLTVGVNAIHIIVDRTERMGRPSGVDENNLFTIRSLPGVIDATVSNAVPVSTSGSSTGMPLEPGQIEGVVPTSLYTVDEHAVRTFSLELVAGRDFTAEDVAFRDVTIPRRDHPIIVSLAFAEKLFPAKACRLWARNSHRTWSPRRADGGNRGTSGSQSAYTSAARQSFAGRHTVPELPH